MNLKIAAAALAMTVLSTLSTTKTEACDRCQSRAHYSHGWCYNGYLYGPDGWYARHKSCCSERVAPNNYTYGKCRTHAHYHGNSCCQHEKACSNGHLR